MLALLSLGLLALATRAVGPGPREGEGPRYDDQRRLIPPVGHERWVLVGASLGLGYAASRPAEGPGAFHRVYLEPRSFDAYLETGAFPEGTMLVLEIYRAATGAPPRRQGFYEGERLAVEVAVKDEGRFPGGWGYFDVTGGPAAPFAPSRCQSCHADHAATDHVFTQFYPRLRSTAGAP